MDFIFHEQQDGGLCAQHCLNSLLQGPYYTAFDLAEFARQLDDAEKEHMKEGDVNSAEFLKFMEQPSSNMDDSGFFSIQVLCKALQVWELELIPFTRPDAAFSRQEPIQEHAFICNLQQHWFTIRKLGHQWFNLNSTQSGPVLITETYLSLFLAQLQQEGYSIFIVNGSLPACEADRMLRANPVASPHSEVKQTMQCKMNKSEGESIEPAKTVDLQEVRLKRMQYFDRANISKVGEVSDRVQHPEKLEVSSNGDSARTKSYQTNEGTNQSAGSSASQSVEETEEELIQAAIELSKLQK